MKIHITALLLALVISVATTPLVRRYALRIGAVSRPGGRHVHGRTIPRLGGIALGLSWLVPIVILCVYDRASVVAGPGEFVQLIGLMCGAAALCVLGAVDDARGVRAAHKLVVQVLMASIAFAFGFRIEAIQLPLLDSLPMGVFAFPVTVFWIVGVTNAVNLIDGLDGLAAGVAFFAALTSFIIATLSGSPFVALTMATLMGALIGFLFFNFNPARIFMGDSGSYFLGYVLATTALAGTLQQKASTAVSLLVPILALGLPIFDTVVSMLRRILERRPIFLGDRRHVHHRLLELGLTHRRAVILLYGVSVVLAGGAIGVSLGRSWQVGVALLSVTVVFVGLVRFLGGFEFLHSRRRQESRLRDPLTASLCRTIPQLIVEVARAKDEASILKVFDRLLTESVIACIQLTSRGGVVRRWTREDVDPSTRDFAEISFWIGPSDLARASVTFAWQGETDYPSPQTDILLQVLVDSVANALSSTGSTFAALPVHVEDMEPASPAVVAGFR